MNLYIDGIGLWGPGLFGWPAARAVLRGEAEFNAEQRAIPASALLPAAERRRSPATVRLALQVAEEACVMAERAPASMPSVFTSSQGDTQITDYMCRELARPDAAVSPTKFHNSVHNAASGYWTIATGNLHSANAVCGHLDSFACGLGEAAAQAWAEDTACLLVAYDIAAPAPLSTVCPTSVDFGLALVLNVQPTARSIIRLSVRLPLNNEAPASDYSLPDSLQPLRMANPIARALPLLHAAATGTRCVLEQGPWIWDVQPWS